jgi:hypothetical protein
MVSARLLHDRGHLKVHRRMVAPLRRYTIQRSLRRHPAVEGPRDRSTKYSGCDAADGFGDISGEPVLFRYRIE